MAIYFLLLSLVAVVAGTQTREEDFHHDVARDLQSSSPNPFCPICLNGNRAMGSNSIAGLQCQAADILGRSRSLTAEECSFYQALAAVRPQDPCECGDPTSKPTPMPVAMPTLLPTSSPSLSPTDAPTFEPSLEPTEVPTSSPTPLPNCNICRDSPLMDATITNPGATIASLEGMIITCQEAQNQATKAFGQPGFTEGQCLDFQSLAIGTCGCPFEPTEAPVVAPVTAAPSDSPPTVPFCTICQNGNPATGGNLVDMSCEAVDALAVPVNLPLPTPTASPTPEPTPMPTETPRFPCNICRDGGILQDPGATLVSFLQASISCGTAQFIGGPNGMGLTLTQCAIAQALAVNTCGCPNEPTLAPALAPTTVAPTSGPETVFCLICPNGNEAMGVGFIGSMLCQQVDMMGRRSELTQDQCLAAQIRAAQLDDVCGCFPDTPAPIPILPTTAPVPSPTPEPTPIPTDEQRSTCSICGDGFVRNEDAIIFFDPLLEIPITCQQAKIIGVIQGYTADECLLVQTLAIIRCTCSNQPTPSPSLSPSTLPSSQPSSQPSRSSQPSSWPSSGPSTSSQPSSLPSSGPSTSSQPSSWPSSGPSTVLKAL